MNKSILKGLDLSAALWAGLIAGTVFLVTMLLLSANVLGSSDLVYRMMAAILQGEGAMAPSTPVDGGLIGSALLVHYALSIAFGLVIAIVIHRWGLIVGLLGGAALGLALYTINFFSVSYFFPWFFPLRNWIWLLGHVLFGAAAGASYELLEIDEDEEGDAQ